MLKQINPARKRGFHFVTWCIAGIYFLICAGLTWYLQGGSYYLSATNSHATISQDLAWSLILTLILLAIWKKLPRLAALNLAFWVFVLFLIGLETFGWIIGAGWNSISEPHILVKWFSEERIIVFIYFTAPATAALSGITALILGGLRSIHARKSTPEMGIKAS